MKKLIFQLEPPMATSWEEVFKIDRSIEMETFITAEMMLKKSGAINLNHPAAAGMEEGVVRAPVPCHLIRHREFGAYLIDAGMDCSYQKRPYGPFKGLRVGKYVGKCFQKPGWDIKSRLKKGGIQLKGVFLSHLHFDHVAGVLDLPKDDSILYIAGKNESYRYMTGESADPEGFFKRLLFRCPDFLAGVETVYEIDFTAEYVVDMPILGKCADIFGDGSLWAVFTPGHTPGHMAFLVNRRKGGGPVLLAGDACLLRGALEKGIGPGVFSIDVDQAQETLDKIIAFTREYPHVTLLCGHEMPTPGGAAGE